MAQPISAPQPYYPQIDREIDPRVSVHLQRLYPAINDHDAAIVTLKSQLNAAITAAKTATSTSTVVTVTSAVTAFPGIGTVNDQTGAVAYTTQTSDNGALLLLRDASPVAVTLNSVVTTPYFLFATNYGAGTATFTPTSGTINGGASFALATNYFAMIVYDGTDWETSALVVLPVTAAAVTHEWLASYNAATGAFTQTQPAVGDVTGAAPLASPTFTGTVTLPTIQVGAVTVYPVVRGQLTSTGTATVTGTISGVTGASICTFSAANAAAAADLVSSGQPYVTPTTNTVTLTFPGATTVGAAWNILATLS
jgi:hypothetical protein